MLLLSSVGLAIASTLVSSANFIMLPFTSGWSCWRELSPTQSTGVTPFKTTSSLSVLTCLAVLSPFTIYGMRGCTNYSPLRQQASKNFCTIPFLEDNECKVGVEQLHFISSDSISLFSVSSDPTILFLFPPLLNISKKCFLLLFASLADHIVIWSLCIPDSLPNLWWSLLSSTSYVHLFLFSIHHKMFWAAMPDFWDGSAFFVILELLPIVPVVTAS